MRIAYDHQIFGAQVYGGISRYFFELVNQLAQTPNIKTTVIAPLYVNAYLQTGHLQLRVCGVKIPSLRRTGRFVRTINRILTPSILRYKKPDVLHETYYSFKSHRTVGWKTVLTVYDMIHERFSDSFSASDSTAKEKAAAVARADHIICISEHTRRDLIELLGVAPTKISVVHLGFSLTQAPLQALIKRERPFLLYVGGRAGYKNFESLLQAYATNHRLYKQYDLLAFGGGAFTPKELTLISDLKIPPESVVHISGSDAVLAGLYQQASLFVYPSLYEGFGIPPLEAMSFGCPVVCSNVSSIPEVVGNAAEFFDPYSITSIEQVIVRVLNDANLRADLKTKGYARVAAFSWQKCAQETLAIYKKITQ